MNCKAIRQIIDEHRSGQISPAERSEFDRHLAGCRACSLAAAGYEALARESAPGPRAGLLQSIVARLPDPVSETRSRPLRFGWQTSGGLAAMAALVMIAMLNVFGLREGPEISAEPELIAGQDQFGGDALPFVEGRDYTSVVPLMANVDISGRVSAWVFFMWSCLHCFELEEALSEWVARQDPAAVDVVRVPVQWNEVASLQARAFYAAGELGVSAAVSDAFYSAIHQRGLSLTTREAIEELFLEAGVDAEDFALAFDSDDVRRELESARDLARDFRIDSTPSLVVGGRFLTSPAMAGSGERMLEVADWLIDRAQQSEACGIGSTGSGAAGVQLC